MQNCYTFLEFLQHFLKNKSTAAFRKLASSKRLIVNAAEKAGRWVQGSSAQTDELAGEEDMADMLEVKFPEYRPSELNIIALKQLTTK